MRAKSTTRTSRHRESCGVGTENALRSTTEKRAGVVNGAFETRRSFERERERERRRLGASRRASAESPRSYTSNLREIYISRLS